MVFERWFRVAVVLAVLGFASRAPAQQGDGPPVNGLRRNQQVAPNVFGTQNNILQIPASAFQPVNSAQAWYINNGYMFENDNYAGGLFWAPVTLPAGTEINYLDLYYYDADAASDITANLYAFYGTTTPGSMNIVSVSSSGNGGYGYAFSNPISHTVNNDVAYGG